MSHSKNFLRFTYTRYTLINNINKKCFCPWITSTSSVMNRWWKMRMIVNIENNIAKIPQSFLSLIKLFFFFWSLKTNLLTFFNKLLIGDEREREKFVWQVIIIYFMAKSRLKNDWKSSQKLCKSSFQEFIFNFNFAFSQEKKNCEKFGM